jgi:hypothetical protein
MPRDQTLPDQKTRCNENFASQANSANPYQLDAQANSANPYQLDALAHFPWWVSPRVILITRSLARHVSAGLHE